MTKLGIFFHALLSQADPHVPFEHAISVMDGQMEALRQCGVLAVAHKKLIGVDGSDADVAAAAEIAGEGFEVVRNNPMIRTEMGTLKHVAAYAAENPDAYVLYHHTKGCSHPNDLQTRCWRECMQRAVVENWHLCVGALDQGYESAGCHWLTHAQYAQVGLSIWGGNFWWAKASFINTLKPLPEEWGNSNRWEAELWIGTGPRDPKTQDYHPVFPGFTCCR